MSRYPLAVIVVASVLATGCGKETANTARASITTVDGAYAQAARTLRRGVYHAVITYAGGPHVASPTNIERWVDVAADDARDDTTYSDDQQRPSASHSLLTGNVLFTEPGGRPVNAWTCHRVTAAASWVLGCPGPLAHWTSQLTSGTWAGQAALVLTTNGTTESEDSHTTFTAVTYLDPATALPLAATQHETTTGDHAASFNVRAIYRSEFLEATAATKRLFDPAALDWQHP